jgi:FixJ family two-component response regulator
MSGFPESMADTKSGDFPGAAFLAKPFSAQMLVDAVRERLPAEVRARQRTQ